VLDSNTVSPVFSAKNPRTELPSINRTDSSAGRSDLSLSDSLDAETPKRDQNTMANVGIAPSSQNLEFGRSRMQS
jgi:hypothetical protein